MPKCCVRGCNSKYNKNQPQPQLSLHKLPTRENLRRQWVEKIGKENMNPKAKVHFVCSLHFEESCFNRTLDQIRLHDNSVPSIFPRVSSRNVPIDSSPKTSKALQQISSRNVHIDLPLQIIQSLPGTSKDLQQVDPAKVQKLTEKCRLQKNKIKRLQTKCRRQTAKIADFRKIIEDLKSQKLLDHDSAILLEDCAGPKDFLKRQINKSKGLPLQKHYSEEMKKFAITLHFLSPKAYNFIRDTYNTCLPHTRTLSRWYQSIDAEPGFTIEAFETLKLTAQLSKNPILCSLIIDEMSIRKAMCWDPTNNKYCGRIDYGSCLDSDSLEEASQCLVFMLTAINSTWKLPVGYFLINSLNGEQKSNLVKICIKMTEETAVKIVSLTCDGPASNFSMLNALGCNNLTSKNPDPTFTHSESKLNVFVDPCHALKLVRNAFGELKVFIDIQGREINFKYLEMLLKLQEDEKLHLGTKLTKAHIHFFNQKMKVRLAVQLLSDSVADALEFCSKELKIGAFANCEGTVNFIRIINRVFDVLNSRSMRPPGWKKALCPKNIGFVMAMLEFASDYINSLKLPSGQLLVESRRKTGFIGLIIDMKSGLALYQRLVVEEGLLLYLPLYKISQDHLELFFSSIRARGGFNNNPNAVQFRAAYKRLLIRAEIRDGGVGNCIPLQQINILNCSIKTTPTKNINALTNKNSFVEIEEDESDLFDKYFTYLELNLSEYSTSVIIYIAGFVAKKLTKRIKCDECIELLHGDPDLYKSSLITQKSRGGLQYPSKDLIKILEKTEKLIRPHLGLTIKVETYYLYIFKFLLDYFTEDGTFSLNNLHDTNHKYLLIKSAIKCYINLRFKYHGKKSTERLSIRNHLTKIILFRNE